MCRAFKLSAILFLFLSLFALQAQARPLQICTHSGFEPYVIQGKDSLTGIDIEIVLAILNNLKQPAEIKAYPWKRLISLIENGECDMGFSLFDTDDRRDFARYLFTVPMHYSTFSVFVRRSNPLKFNRISDFFNLRIAHNRGFALSVGFEQAIADGKIKRLQFDNVKSAIKMLENGRIDAIIDNEARFRYYLKKQNKLGIIKSLNIPFMPHQPAFLVLSRKSNMTDIDKIRRRFERELKTLHLNGTILAISNKYLN
ncbi:substrate-binding periplasmic protein [Terasakiella sp.]|uniref:substrate-binding periplasmic protein n=1 Tax=Terasakiella sp. TaxID=2034861 RepID=UPI003AA7B0A9